MSETDVGPVVISGGPVRAVLVDLEGTLFANGGALPAAAVAVLREQGRGIRFLAYIDSQSPAPHHCLICPTSSEALSAFQRVAG